MKILTIIFASLFLIFRYCTMEPEQYEFVSIKNNVDIAILATINTQEPLDSLCISLCGVVVSPYDMDALSLTYKRNTFLKKYNKNLRNNGRMRVKFDKWLVHIPFLCYLTILLNLAEGAVYGGY